MYPKNSDHHECGINKEQKTTILLQNFAQSRVFPIPQQARPEKIKKVQKKFYCEPPHSGGRVASNYRKE